MKREYKLNFDAAFSNGITHTGVVIRNDMGTILGAWTNYFMLQNLFCAEAEAAVQALKILQDLKMERVNSEGDELNVIPALKGNTDADDWRAKHILEEGKKLLGRYRFWFMDYLPRSGNFCAHNIAKWASRSNFCGQDDLIHCLII